MVEAHPESRYLHLGCDEVWCLCLCERCREAFGGSKAGAFLTYVNRLIAHTAGRGRIPVIWHDMLAGCTDDELALLDKRAVVMIWRYDGRNIERTVETFATRCRAQGIAVLGAPSIRAWDRTDDQPHPVAANRVRNIDQWTRAANRLGIPGAVATNWGTVFGMGVPYGIFETTWYLMGYAAERFWNADSDRDDYLPRFLPDEMADHFMRSRFFLHDWLDENLYRKTAFLR